VIVPAEEWDVAKALEPGWEARMRRQSDYGAVAVRAALIGCWRFFFLKVPLG